MTYHPQDYRRWLYRLAHDMLWESSSARAGLTVDDLAQEGSIAMWRASQSFDAARGHLAAHLTNAARLRMLDVVMGKKPSFGTEGNRGRVKVPEELVGPLPEPGSPYEPIVETFLDAEADGRLVEALAAMSPTAREYVERVFWGDERLRRDRAAWREAETVIRAHFAA